MKDHKVGELWTRWHLIADLYPHACDICDLIRKLVEERARRYLQWQSDVAFSTNRDKQLSELRYALRDFGIDPETWK
jgi:hypothetical protein